MKAVLEQQHSNVSYCQPQIPNSIAGSRFVAVLSAGFAAVSLLMATLAFGKTTAITVTPGESQKLTCVMKGQSLACDAQQPGKAPKTIIFEQKTSTKSASETTEPASLARTALLTPDLDERLSNVLIWAVYLGLPITTAAAIWSHDQRAREQMVNLAQHITMLERIWQHPPTR